MRMKIGDIAKMLGIVPSTLRYYEKIGIVAPEIDQKTKYRYYHARDLVWLILCRGLYKTGLSLSETAEFVYGTSYESARKRIEELQADVHRQLRRLQRMESYLANLPQQWETARELCGRCTLWQRPALLRLDFQGESLFSDPQRMEIVSAWLKYLPFVHLQQMITPQELAHGTKGLDHIWGLAVNERFALETGVPQGPQVRRIAGSLCVRTAFEIDVSGALYPRHYAHALAFLENHRFSICGSAETEVISYAGEKNHRTALLVMDIPVHE